MNDLQSPWKPPSQTVDDLAGVATNIGRRAPNPFKIIGKWLAVCTISAGPSFFLGLSISVQSIDEIVAMIAGILTFVGLYTWVELTEPVQRLMANRDLRVTAYVGYGTRVAISIVFPISVYLDLLCGLASVAFTDWLGIMELGTARSSSNFIGFYVTTLVQGFILNVVLFAYMLLVYGIIRVARTKKRQSTL